MTLCEIRFCGQEATWEVHVGGETFLCCDDCTDYLTSGEAGGTATRLNSDGLR